MRKALVVIPVTAVLALVAQQTQIFPVLKSTVLLGKQPGFYLVANNQLLRPWGELTTIPGRPVDMTSDSQHRFLAVLNTRALLLLDPGTGATLGQVTAHSTSYAGIAFRPGDRELWASETARSGGDAILIAPLDELGKPGEPARIELKGHPVPAGIAFAPDGKTAYVALSRNNTLAVIDTATRTVKEEIPAGLAPFAVVATADRVFVTNRAGRRPVLVRNIVIESECPLATAREATMGREAIAGDELQGYRRRPYRHAESHPVVGCQGMEHSLPGCTSLER